MENLDTSISNLDSDLETFLETLIPSLDSEQTTILLSMLDASQLQWGFMGLDSGSIVMNDNGDYTSVAFEFDTDELRGWLVENDFATEGEMESMDLDDWVTYNDFNAAICQFFIEQTHKADEDIQGLAASFELLLSETGALTTEQRLVLAIGLVVEKGEATEETAENEEWIGYAYAA